MDVDALVGAIEDRLADAGIVVDAPAVVGSGPVKVVCLSGRLAESLEEMSARPRDQVVMVRVSAEVVEDLDAWVETGAVRSRSEAAAVFIREGLQLRAAELERLREAIGGVREARDRLRREASRVLGATSEESAEVDDG